VGDVQVTTRCETCKGSGLSSNPSPLFPNSMFCHACEGLGYFRAKAAIEVWDPEATRALK
jgi:DnaJ-class molecular chaperone